MNTLRDAVPAWADDVDSPDIPLLLGLYIKSMNT